MSTCRNCKQVIEFRETVNGAMMPVDSGMVYPDECEEGDMLVNQRGECSLAKNADDTQVWFVSHFSSCPDLQPDKYKLKKEKVGSEF